MKIRYLDAQILRSIVALNLLALMSTGTIAATELSGGSRPDSRQNIDRPVRAIADSDPLRKCPKNKERSSPRDHERTDCDPRDAVLLPDVGTEPDGSATPECFQ